VQFQHFARQLLTAHGFVQLTVKDQLDAIFGELK